MRLQVGSGGWEQGAQRALHLCSPAHQGQALSREDASSLRGRLVPENVEVRCVPPLTHGKRCVREDGAREAVGRGRQGEPLGLGQTPGRLHPPDAEAQAQSPLSLCSRCKHLASCPWLPPLVPGEGGGDPCASSGFLGLQRAGGFEHETQRPSVWYP